MDRTNTGILAKSLANLPHICPPIFPDLDSSARSSVFPADMPLHVRRSSDPSLAGLPLQEAPAGPEEEPRNEPSPWSSTSSFQKHGLKVKPGGAGTDSLERKVEHRLGRRIKVVSTAPDRSTAPLRQSRYCSVVFTSSYRWTDERDLETFNLQQPLFSLSSAPLFIPRRYPFLPL